MSKAERLIQLYQSDFTSFAEDCITIRDHDSAKLLPLRLNRGQRILHAVAEKQRREKGYVRIIFLKSRRFGGSTYVEGRFYWRTSLNFNRNAFIIAHETDSTATLFRMVQLMQEKNPVAPSVIKSNAQELRFDKPNGRGLKSEYKLATAKNVDAGRSQGIHYLHISEESAWPVHADDLLNGLFQCVPDLPMETEIFRESTAKGFGNTFQKAVFDIYSEGRYPYYSEEIGNGSEYIFAYYNPGSAWVLVFIPWFVHNKYSLEFESDVVRKAFTERLEKAVEGDINFSALELIDRYGLTLEQLYWREQTILNKCGGSIDKFRQEYPDTVEDAFLTTGSNKFPKALCDKLEMECESPLKIGDVVTRLGKPIISPNSRGNMRIWEFYNKKDEYFMTVDAAGGKKQHKKLKREPDFTNIDIYNRRTGVQAAQWHGHMDYDLIDDLAEMIGDMYGRATACVELQNHGYTVVAGLAEKNYPMFEHKPGEPGWQTNKRTKPLMIDGLLQCLRDGSIRLKSKETVSELRTFIEESGKFHAEAGCKDDRVITAALASQMLSLLDVKTDIKISPKNIFGYNDTSTGWMAA